MYPNTPTLTRALRLRELPPTETPRVRLCDVGPAALSDAELLAILLRSGVAGANALDLARQLLVEHDGWAGLLRADIVTLCRSYGIGVAKATTIKAGLEIGRRLLLAEPVQRLQVKSPADIAPLLMAEMAHLDQEQLRTVLLDTKNRVICIHTVYIGSLNTSLIRVGEVFRKALERNSAAIIVAHNHPSGQVDPSPEDVLVTREIVAAGQLLDVECIDHLILGHTGWLSMRQRGLGFSG
jgi:DNA repair protein RadC